MTITPSACAHLETQDCKLQELFPLYVDFMIRLGQERKRDYSAEGRYDFADFKKWWTALDAPMQRICENDFRAGYEAVIEEAEKQVAQVVENYKAAVEVS